MTHENLFREIDEDLERQKYEALWKRYGAFIIATALAVIVGTAANSYLQAQRAADHQAATGELVAALAQSSAAPDKTVADLLSFAESHHGYSQAALAELHAAAFAAKDGKKDNALKIYDALAKDDKADHAFRQLADLLAVQLQLDNGDPAALQARLQPLLGEKEPWHGAANELSGYLAIRSGDKAKAREIFTALSQDAGLPPAMNARAADMLRLLSQ